MRSEEGFLLLTEAGAIRWANISAAELLGYSRGELLQMSLSSIETSGNRHPDAPCPLTRALRSIMEGEITEIAGDARISTKVGKRIAVHWRMWLLPGGPVGQQILFALSETAQTSAEGPITASYRDIFENAVEGIFRSTIRGQYIEVNPALAKMFGYGTPAESMAALQDLNTQLYVQPGRRAEFLRLMREQGYVAGFESEVWRADRTSIWISEFARTVSDRDGVPLYFEGSVIDVTVQKISEAALRESEERFRRLAETTNVVPFEFDATSERFLYLGPQAETIFAPGLVRGCTLDFWAAMLHPEDFELGINFARSAGRRSTLNFQHEFRLRVANDRIIWVKQIVHCANGPDDDPDRVRGFLFDITKAKREEEDRESSRLQLRELAARSQQVREDERMSIAREIHDELGQALTMLKIDLSWFSGHLLESLSGDLRKTVRERTTKMESLIHGTLQAVRRILSALRPPLLDELGLKDAIEFQMQEFSKRVGIRYEVKAEPVRVLSPVVVNAVFRIFQEILTNVARHANASRIKVLLKETESHVLLRVEDNGRGIRRDKPSTTKSFGLLGMRERAWAIGAELEINEIAAPGTGTVVALRVPLEAPKALVTAD